MRQKYNLCGEAINRSHLILTCASLSAGDLAVTAFLCVPVARYRIGEKFSSELSYNYNDFDLPVPGGDFTANLMRLRLSYSFTPKILLQLLSQYNEIDDTVSTNLRFSWLQSANTGLFLVYNEVNESGLGALRARREFTIKYSHIFDVLK